MKMKLGMVVGLSPSHIVLDGGPAPLPQKGHNPQFSAYVCCGQMAGWIKMPLVMGVGPSDVSDGDSAPPTERGTAAPSTF